jgi:hypothetical protein
VHDAFLDLCGGLVRERDGDGLVDVEAAEIELVQERR